MKLQHNSYLVCEGDEVNNSVSPTFLVGGGSVDGRGQQRRSEEDVQGLVPVRGTGEYDDCLAQELLLWGDSAARLPWCSWSSCFKTRFTVKQFLSSAHLTKSCPDKKKTEAVVV